VPRRWLCRWLCRWLGRWLCRLGCRPRRPGSAILPLLRRLRLPLGRALGATSDHRSRRRGSRSCKVPGRRARQVRRGCLLLLPLLTRELRLHHGQVRRQGVSCGVPRGG